MIDHPFAANPNNTCYYYYYFLNLEKERKTYIYMYRPNSRLDFYGIWNMEVVVSPHRGVCVCPQKEMETILFFSKIKQKKRREGKGRTISQAAMMLCYSHAHSLFFHQTCFLFSSLSKLSSFSSSLFILRAIPSVFTTIQHYHHLSIMPASLSINNNSPSPFYSHTNTQFVGFTNFQVFYKPRNQSHTKPSHSLPIYIQPIRPFFLFCPLYTQQWEQKNQTTL